MIIEVKYVKECGDLDKERIVLSVVKDGDVGRYAIFDTTYTKGGSVSNKVRFTYWFPDKNVKAGDLVVVYTKAGSSSEHQNKDGSTSHFFYWGLDRTVWNEDGDCAVIARIDSWKGQAIKRQA